MLQNLFDKLLAVLKDGTSATLTLFKVMVPIVICVRLLQEFELITLLAKPLGPAMRFVGLPAEMGLVWATALLNNIYSGMIVFLSLVEHTPVTTAQATVLGVMVLIAHGLPVELSIARKSGPRFLFQAITRVGSALLLGWLLTTIYDRYDLLQEPAAVLLQPEASSGPVPWGQWLLDQAINFASIYAIILSLLAMMRLMEGLGVIGLLNRMLRPILQVIGIGPKASAITVIGLTLGISYGGGLIIHGARSGDIDRKDIFYSLTLMGITHSLVEDTLLLVMLGGHLSGLLWARLAFSLIFVALLVQVARRLPERFCDRFFWGPPKPKEYNNE